MHTSYRTFALTVLAALLAGCAATSLKSTWKSPDSGGQTVRKPAVIAIEERSLARQGFENRFVNQLKAGGQEAAVTFDLLGLPEIKADRAAAVARLKQAGADSVIVLRLVDVATYDRQVQETPNAFVSVVDGFGSYGWYDYYSVAYADFGVMRGETRQVVCLEASLFALEGSKRLWSGITRTVIKEGSDRLVLADQFTALVVAAMRKDGVVR